MTIEDIALQMTPGIGVKGAVHLLGIFGDARGIFAAAPEELAMKAALRKTLSGISSTAKASPPQKRNSATAAAIRSLRSLRPTPNSRHCCVKYPIIPMYYT